MKKIALLFITILLNLTILSQTDTVLVAEEIPQFPGGIDSIKKYIAENINYPQSAKDKKIEGTVYVRFLVTKNGKVDKAEIAESVHKTLDNEAIRVIKSLPQFEPAYSKNGKPIDVWYIYPIDFVLSSAPTGWKFGGALPAIGYDSDIGYRYGALANIYDWGDGSQYPNYVRNIYLEWSRTTKGSGINSIQYDDTKLFGLNVRFTGEIGYYIEQALDFYGYNGYQAIFNSDFSNTESDYYKTRMFYRMDRRTFRGIFDFQIPLNDKFLIYSGLSIINNKISSVDINKLNKGKDEDELLPSVDSMPGLYERYIDWKIIPENQANGGFITQIKAGLVFDTRNSEALPTKGLWEEVIFLGSPGIKGTQPYLQIFATHRQYFNIITKRLSFAYRIAFQSKLAGDIPFYMLPYYYNTKRVRDGIGGSTTVRGVLRNRVQAEAVSFGNAEIRWRVINTRIFNQDFYIALSAFTDVAQVVIAYEVDFSNVPDNQFDQYFSDNDKDIYKPHLSYGGGLHLALNENFIVAVDCGIANNKQDGNFGLYIGLDWLF